MPLSAIVKTDFAAKSPTAAVRIFAKKSSLTGSAAREVRDAAGKAAGRIAALNKVQLIQDVMKGLRRGIANGESFATVQRRLLRILSSAGVDSVPLHRLRLIIRQSTLTAYNVSRLRVQFSEPVADAFPYLQYLTQADRFVRPEHAALHGRILAKDDPIWDRIYPPWDYNCRCFTRDVSEREFAKLGGQRKLSTGEFVLTKMRVKGKTERGIDVPPEFDHPRDQFRDREIISQVEPSLRKLLQEAISDAA